MNDENDPDNPPHDPDFYLPPPEDYSIHPESDNPLHAQGGGPLEPAPDDDWVDWAERTYEFEDSVRVFLKRRREKRDG